MLKGRVLWLGLAVLVSAVTFEVNVLGQTSKGYDFFAEASRAVWISEVNGESRNVPFPWIRGQVDWVLGTEEYDTLEDGLRHYRLLLTTPERKPNANILGIYRNVTIPPNAVFEALIGLAGSPRTGTATFVVLLAWEGGPSKLELARMQASYDGRLDLFRVDLSRYAGITGSFGLCVETGSSALQEFTVAVWVNPRILIASGNGPRADVGVFKPSNRTWYFDFGRNGTTDAQLGPWGAQGDLPIAGDFNGDGLDDIAVFRPSNCMWYFDYNLDGATDVQVGPWGASDDLPFAVDDNGDGIDWIAVFRPSNQKWYYAIDGRGATKGYHGPWGAPGDIPLAGDFDGDGVWDIAVFRPRTGIWYFDFHAKRGTDSAIGPWGKEGDLPIAGDFNGDGADDIAVFRPSTRMWYFDYGCNGITDAQMGPWGEPGDLPFAGRFASRRISSSGQPSSTNSLGLASVNQTSSREALIVIRYTYSGQQGIPVLVGAWPTQGGNQAPGFGYVPARIDAPGSGTVTIRVEYHGPSSIVTDGIEVVMYRPDGSIFLRQNFSRSLTWR